MASWDRIDYVPLDQYSANNRKLQAAVCALSITAIVALSTAFYLGALAYPESENISPAVNTDASQKVNDLVHQITNAIDKETSPCEDFYQYACGAFLDNFKIPPSFDEWWMRENVVEEQVREKLRSILADDWPIVSRFYRSCMDTDTRDKVGSVPLAPYLLSVHQAPSLSDLMFISGTFHQIHAPTFMEIDTVPDLKNPDWLVLSIKQGGIPLDPSMYANVDLMQQYRSHISNMMLLADKAFPGRNQSVVFRREEADLFAAEVVELESKLAKSFEPDTESDLELYHRFDVAGLETEMGDIPWRALFEGSGNKYVNDIVVENIQYASALNSILYETNLTTLKKYVTWQLVHSVAPSLSTDFVNENFNFFEHVIQGTRQMPDQTFSCIKAADEELGQLLGHYYIMTSFSPESRVAAKDLVSHVQSALADQFDDVRWMDNSTRAASRRKLARMKQQVGYPDRWPSFEDLRLPKNQFAESVLEARRYQFHRHIRRVGGRADISDWSISTSTVNAYYAPDVNTMVLPAGQLQQPDFDADYPASANYGSMATTIAHEMTHGFDDNGELYDEFGRLKRWLPKEVMKAFKQEAKCVKDLYDRIEVEPGYHIDGRLTLGENIADLGGIKIAYRALKELLEGDVDRLNDWRHPVLPLDSPTTNGTRRGRQIRLKDPSVVPGFSEEQLFFVSYGQSWCRKGTPEWDRLQLRENEHAPTKYRCNVPLQSLKEFATAFNCPEGSPMAPPSSQTCDIWG